MHRKANAEAKNLLTAPVCHKSGVGTLFELLRNGFPHYVH